MIKTIDHDKSECNHLISPLTHKVTPTIVQLSQPTEHKMKLHKSIKIDEEIVIKIQKMADKEERSFNNMLEVLLRKAVKK